MTVMTVVIGIVIVMVIVFIATHCRHVPTVKATQRLPLR